MIHIHVSCILNCVLLQLSVNHYDICNICHRFSYIPAEDNYLLRADDSSALGTDDGESYIRTDDESCVRTEDDDAELYANHPKVSEKFIGAWIDFLYFNEKLMSFIKHKLFYLLISTVFMFKFRG